MAKPILVANWKNHPGSLDETRTLLKELSRKRELFKKTSLFIAPPSTYLESVSERVRGFGQLASQSIAVLPSGNHTGQITPEILQSFGVRSVIVGHSEQRALGETLEDVANKVKASLRAGISPILCIGESSHDQDGEHFEFLREQLRTALSGIPKKSDTSKLVIAYEPVWAIGKSSKDAISPMELSQVVIFIKKVLTDLLGRKIAERIPILYGGSVEPANASGLMGNADIDGFLVGHASLNAKSFISIAKSILE